MSRRRHDPFKQNLIRLLRKGKRQEALDLVQDTLAKSPSHPAALKEWQRLQSGQSFSYEAADQRKKQEYVQQLEKILIHFAQNPSQLTSLSLSELKKRSAQLRIALRRAGGSNAIAGITAEQYTLYKNALTKEKRRRKKNKGGKALLIVGILAGIGVLTAGGLALVHRAHQAADVLAHVWEHNALQPDIATEALKTYDTGLNRMLDRRVGYSADKIQYRIQQQNERIKQAVAILSEIKKGNRKLTELSITDRIEIQNTCRIRSRKSDALIQMWNTLYLREKEQMERQQNHHIADLLTPLPAMPALSGIPQEDMPILEQRLTELQQKKQRYQELKKLYQLNKKGIKHFVAEHKRLSQTKQELQQLLTCFNTLPAAHSYESYLGILKNRPVLLHYTAADSILATLDQLPGKQDFRLAMQQHAAPMLSPALIPVAIRTLVYGGSSVSTTCPATREQLQTMENVFALSGAPIVLYQLINKKNDVCYSETAPEIKDNQVIFRRSVYDPERQTGDIRPVAWENPRAVWIKTIDARPVWNACGFDRPQQFFNEAHFPTILSNVLNTEAPHCPALARAYFYHKISELIRQHRAQTLVGIGFAPTMEQHMADFEQLRRKCDISLDGMCWLKVTPKHMAAEQAFARWFRKHQGTFYEKEISQAAEKQLLMHAQYCGYINEWGQPVFQGEQPQPGTRIWYADHGQVCSFSIGSEKASLPRLSPLFIPKKVYKKQYQP